MFEKITLRRSIGGPAITAGEVAEALLFFDHVHIILDYGSLNGLIDQMGMQTLLSTLNRDGVSGVYCDNSLATHNETKNGVTTHSFIAYRLAGSQETGPLTSRKKILEFVLSRKGYSKKQAKRHIERFRRMVPGRDISSDYFIKGGVPKAVGEDLLDDSFLEEAARLSITAAGLQTLPTEFVYRARRIDKSFVIETNLDFERLNTARKARGEDGNFTNGNILQNIVSAREDLILASHYGSEFYTSDLSSSIIQLKFREILRKSELDSSSLRAFEEIVLEGAPSLSNVINSKQRSFDEFLSLLDKAQKFKDWTRTLNPDANLVREYFEQVRSEGWLSSTPTKGMRYITTNIWGLLEPVTGQLASLADSFLLDKLVGGWKPSHFVDRNLRPFLREDV